MDQVSNWYLAHLHPYITPVTDQFMKETVNHPWISTSAFLVGILVIYYYTSRPRNLPPGPIGLPLIGSPHLITDDLARGLNEQSKKWGDLYSFYIGWTPVVVLNSHKLIKEAFVKRGDEFSDRADLCSPTMMYFSDEIFLAKFSKDWINNKKFMMKALKSFGFGTNMVEDMFKANLEIFYDYVDSLGGAAFDPSLPLSRMNACTSARITYGAVYKHLEEPELLLLCQLNAGIVPDRSMTTRWTYWIDNTPFWLTKLLCPGIMKSMRQSCKNYIKFFLKKIDEHRKSLDRKQPRDLIDSYLIERGDDPQLTDKILAANIIATTIDSVETAPTFMTWVFLYLASYPDMQKKIQEQIDVVCGERRPGFADRAALSLVEATITEVGRVVTPVCVTFSHRPMKDTTLNGYTIPKTSSVVANLWAAHRDPELFPRGEAFKPEAFIDEDGSFMRSEKTMTFGLGRRSCIGEQMAKNELFLLVSNTLQRYSLEFPAGEPRPSLQDYGSIFRLPQPFTIRAIKRKH